MLGTRGGLDPLTTEASSETEQGLNTTEVETGQGCHTQAGMHLWSTKEKGHLAFSHNPGTVNKYTET